MDDGFPCLRVSLQFRRRVFVSILRSHFAFIFLQRFLAWLFSSTFRFCPPAHIPSVAVIFFLLLVSQFTLPRSETLPIVSRSCMLARGHRTGQLVGSCYLDSVIHVGAAMSPRCLQDFTHFGSRHPIYNQIRRPKPNRRLLRNHREAATFPLFVLSGPHFSVLRLFSYSLDV